MIKIVNDDIYLTRGDTGIITTSCKNYLFQDGDIIEMTVRVQPEAPSVLIYKKVTEFDEGSAEIIIEPNDTHRLPFGEYCYDIQFTSADGTYVDTYKMNKFILLKEATY